MKLYEIDQAIADLLSNVDPETGEVIVDLEALDALQMERETKIENIILLIKNKAAEATAIGAEIKSLEARKKIADNEVTRLKLYIMYALKGQKFERAKCACSFRRSQKVETLPQFVEWAMKNDPSLLRQKDPEPDKTAIKERLKDGDEIPFASLEESVSVIIR